MAENQYVSKVIYGGETLIDLTADTVTADKVLTGITTHGADGAPIVGTCDFDANTQDATAAVAEVLIGKTYYGQGVQKTGTMPNRGGVKGTISNKDDEIAIQQGYHDGSGTVSISETEKEKLVAGNILRGITILGVEGTCEPSSDVTAQSKTATPSTEQQTIIPDEEIDYLSQVIVEAIPYSEVDNASGGKTVTIA